jgi:ribosomal protein L28
MARICDTCGKGSMIITPRKLLRGNMNPTTKQRKFPNLQTLRYEGGKMKVCTRCLRSIKRDFKKMEESQKA